MASPINKKTLEHLAKLVRIELEPKEETGLLKDLQKILNYFEELKALDTKEVKPMTGGTLLKNIFREDEGKININESAGKEAFPENQKGFLKIPPVFPAEGGSASGGE